MIANDFIKIHETLYEILLESGYEIHHISPSDNVLFPYLTYSYVSGEEIFALKIESWVSGEDIVRLENMLNEVIALLDKKIKFDGKYSYRFYYAGSSEVMIIEETDYLGREINFELKII